MDKLILRIIVWFPLAVFTITGCNKTVSLVTLINEMADRKQLTGFPEENYLLKQFSSYNRASVAPDQKGWFENNDMSHFIRVEETAGRREFVLFDAEGPGAVVRWWMTFYKAQNGVIRVYLDHDTIPSIKGSPSEVVSGSMIAGPPFSASVQAGAPLGEEGRDYDHNLYFPIPFARHCKITYECDSVRLLYNYEGTPVKEGYYWPDVFYNIGYRAYPKNTRIESFNLQTLKEAGSAIADAGKSLLNHPLRSESEKTFEKILQPGDSVVLEFAGKRQAINRLMIEMEAANRPQALRSTVIRASFDGNQTIWAPVGEFFGSGYSLNPHQTWMNQSDGKGRMESFWIMPFRTKCVITYVNYGTENIRLTGSSGLISFRWKPNTMYFGASWHEYNHIMSRDKAGAPFDLNFIDIRGKGVYVGDQITLFNNSYKWWGEGDEKIFVDGESFPSSFGTGSEDYYGYSFGRQEAFSHPFLSQPDGTGNMSRGLTVNMRHRSLDAIPFNKSISSNIELWHWDTICLNYALTSFYYALPPFTQNFGPDQESVRRPVALSGEDMTFDPEPDKTDHYYTADDFVRVPKIDAHFHYLTMDERYLKFAVSQNFRLLTPVWDGEVSISDQLKISNALRHSFPENYAFFTTFPADSFNTSGFADKTIALIRESIRDGATGVKVWKNIGMGIKDPAGKYVTIDDPGFDPVFRYLEENNIPVIGHLGEPKDCWLPEDKMTDPSDVIYYKNNPQYYMYRHPEVPSYDDQIRARDNLLKIHPKLEFVAAHLASLEWSVDELAKRLDSFPNMKTDLAARMYHIQHQSNSDYTHVRDFMIKYQDRIIYGTDIEVHDINGTDPQRTMENIRKGWLAQWIYLATDSTLNVKGLRLPKEVIDKIYYRNAERYFLRIRND